MYDKSCVVASQKLNGLLSNDSLNNNNNYYCFIMSHSLYYQDIGASDLDLSVLHNKDCKIHTISLSLCHEFIHLYMSNIKHYFKIYVTH